MELPANRSATKNELFAYLVVEFAKIYGKNEFRFVEKAIDQAKHVMAELPSLYIDPDKLK